MANSKNKRLVISSGGISGDILRFARSLGRGNPFSTCEVLHLGKRAAVDQALSRMVRAGTLMRVRKGMYVLPRWSKLFGEALPPTVGSMMKAIARVTGESFGDTGESALSALRLTTQNQAHIVYVTSGRSRTLRFDVGPDVHLKHVSAKTGRLLGSRTGTAIAALLHLGKNGVTPDVIGNIKKSLSSEEFKNLINNRGKMPGWLLDRIDDYIREGA
jgi:hypothetical protein